MHKCEPASTAGQKYLSSITGHQSNIISISAIFASQYETAFLLVSFDRKGFYSPIHVWMQLDLKSLLFTFSTPNYSSSHEISFPRHLLFGSLSGMDRVDIEVTYRPFLLQFGSSIFVIPGPFSKIRAENFPKLISHYCLVNNCWSNMSSGNGISIFVENEEMYHSKSIAHKALQPLSQGNISTSITPDNRLCITYDGNQFMLFNAETTSLQFITNKYFHKPFVEPPHLLPFYCQVFGESLTASIFLVQTSMV